MTYPALVYTNETDAATDLAIIDAHCGYPSPGATTWDVIKIRWDGKPWIYCPQDWQDLGLIGVYDADSTLWPEVP